VSQYVFFFGGGKADGNKDMKDTLGGKGSGLAEMTNAGVPVPPGFTISTQACNAYYDSGGKLPAEVDQQMDAALARLEALQGKKLGDPKDPLLVSVRSGSKFSMPGMMDTILNLGMNDKSVAGVEAKTGNPRFARDSYRRFIQMYGNVVLGIDRTFEPASPPRPRAYPALTWPRTGSLVESSNRRAPASPSRRSRPFSSRWPATRCSARG
jgi:pyruvate,orthophosphate dikinase